MTYYVDFEFGNDKKNDGLSEDKPFRTMAKTFKVISKTKNTHKNTIWFRRDKKEKKK